MKLELGTARLQTLADGVFAIAMTILVFEVRLPAGTEPDKLFSALGVLWPKLTSFAVSFMTLGYSWIGHHNQYSVIRRVDRPFLWINLFFLLFIVLVPFTSVLVGEFPFERVSVIVYSANLTCAGALLAVHWSYATHRGRLCDDVDPVFVTGIARRVLVAPLAYIAVIVLAVIDVRPALIACAAIPFLFLLPGKIDRFWTRTS